MTNQQTIVIEIIDLLRQQNATLAIAESCTGGLLSDMLTDVPGASDVFTLGVCTYSSMAKKQILGVACVEEYGAVSRETVLQMAHRVREKAQSTYAIATTGNAGPGRGTSSKPVGTIWIGACGQDWEEARCLTLHFDRRGNKVFAASAAFELLRNHLEASK